MDSVPSAVVVRGPFSLQLDHNFPESRDTSHSILFSTMHTLGTLKLEQVNERVANHKSYPCIGIGKSISSTTFQGLKNSQH